MKKFSLLLCFLLVSLVPYVNAQSTTQFNTSNPSNKIVLTANLSSFTITSGTIPGQLFSLTICQDSNGNHTIGTYPANLTSNALSPLTTTANACTSFPLVWTGSTWSATTTGSPYGSSSYAGPGVPTFSCVSPCLYTQSDASPQTAALYAVVAPTGTVSSNWKLQGGGGGGSSTPPLIYSYYPAAVSINATGYSASWSPYYTNGPTAGSVNYSSSSLGYLGYAAAASAPQYSEITVSLPAYWTSSALSINFYSPSVTGTVIWEVQTACPSGGIAGSPTFSSPISVTTTVNGTANTFSTTASIPTIATPGANGCPASTITTPSPLTIRLFRSSSDTATGQANFLGATLITGRSQ